MASHIRQKKSITNSNLVSRFSADAQRLPEQVADYICLADSRFDEVAKLYLEGLTISDLQFMQPEDLICVVPPDQHRHKLLMSILARRYLFRDDDDNGVPDIFEDHPRDDIKCHDHNRGHGMKKADYCRCCDSSSQISSRSSSH